MYKDGSSYLNFFIYISLFFFKLNVIVRNYATSDKPFCMKTFEAQMFIFQQQKFKKKFKRQKQHNKTL